MDFCPLCPHTTSSGGKCESFHAWASFQYKNSGVLPSVFPSVSLIILVTSLPFGANSSVMVFAGLGHCIREGFEK